MRLWHLRDKLERVNAAGDVLETVRARVNMVEKSGSTMTLYGGQTWSEELRAIIPPNDNATDSTRWRWRGVVYHQEKDAIVSRRGGKDHHMSITLQRRLWDAG